MKPNATLIAVLTAAVLGGGYWYAEVKTKPAREAAAEDAKRVFPGLMEDQVGEILLREGEKPAVLLRYVEGSWRLISPVQAPADEEAVKQVIEGLADVKREEVVVESAAELRNYGLDKPGAAVTFADRMQSPTSKVLFFGAENFDGTKAYAIVDGTSTVFLTSPASRTALMKDADALRDKRLLHFEVGEVVSAKSSVGRGFGLEKDAKGDWMVSAGARREPADVTAVLTWLDQVAHLRGESVAAEKGGDAPYGLGAAAVEIRLADGRRLALQKGKAKDGGPNFFARVKGQPQVWVLPSAAEDKLDKSGRALMDLRAFAFQAGTVERFSLWQGGNTITARRKDFNWSWEAPYTPAAGDKPLDFEEFVTKVAGAERMSVLAESAKPKSPRLTLAFYDGQDRLLEEIWVGEKRGGGLVALSGVKHRVMIVPDNLFEGLPALPAPKK